MNTKLKCLLLDDELPSLTYLKMLCEQIPELEVVRSFNTTDDFLASIKELEFDLCFLDIEMPGLSGLHIAELLNGKPVIFTTGYSEYAASAFDLDAVDYVRKPVIKERLQQAVQKAIKKISGSNHPIKFIQLNTEKGKSLLYFDQVTYIRNSEIDSRDKIARLSTSPELILKNISFGKLLAKLPAGLFCRINKKEVIAIKSVQYFAHDLITTHIIKPDGNPLVLTLSEIYRKDFISLVEF